jgi:hypothetical protein
MSTFTTMVTSRGRNAMLVGEGPFRRVLCRLDAPALSLLAPALPHKPLKVDDSNLFHIDGEWIAMFESEER